MMRRHSLPLIVLMLAAASVLPVAAATHYVNVNGTNPVSPYTSWATAATNIQLAASAASSGDLVLVTNGVYQTGGNVATARLTIVPAITVQSVNGAGVTIINGAGVMRCVTMSSGVKLIGFTLANGAAGTHSGGGVSCLTPDAFAANCIFTNNSATTGGGAQSGTFSNCTFIANVATNYGGGAYGAAVYRCNFVSNSASYNGGGVFQSTLTNCLLTGNAATANGTGSGGGAAQSTLVNCVLAGNRAGYIGGGAFGGTLFNCTVVSNLSSAYNAAVSGCTVNNSIVFYNTAYYTTTPTDDTGSSYFNNCCRYPKSTFELSNVNTVTNPPAFVNLAAGDFHLQPWSPCLNAGNNSLIANATDLDGNPRIVGGTVDMGAYENQNTNGVHYVSATNATPVAPFTNWLTAATNIQDAVAVAQAGEFVIVSNGIYKFGGGIMYGSESNRVLLTNGITLLSLSGAQSTAIVGSILGRTTRCVYVGSNSVLSGFTLANGATIASGDNIKEQSGGGAWCETGGVISNCVIGGSGFPYANGSTPNDACTAQWAGSAVYGGIIYNSTLANNTVTVQGGTAAAATLINCVVTSNLCQNGYAAGLYQGTATNSTFSGNVNYESVFPRAGGAYQSALYNCTFTGNQGYTGGGYGCTNYNCTLANNSGVLGGGVYGGVSYNCLLSSNTASSSGGGAYISVLYGCTVVSNRASSNGGGVYNSTLYNCTLNTNVCSQNGGGAYGGTLNDCVIANNVGASSGGGSYLSTLNNCTLTGNSANQGGGMAFGTANNCILFYNYFTVGGSGSNYISTTLNYCCTAPSPGGFGSITNEPAFVNLTNDFQLQSNSPCINSGNNFYVTNTTDFDGNPRIAGGTVDLGAYEFPSPASTISYAYLQQYGLPTDGSADNADPDGDGFSNAQEWIAGTNPTNAASRLQLTAAAPTNNFSGATITWQSVNGVNYFVQRTADLRAPLATIATNLPGQTGTTSYTDTNATGSGPYFYRVGTTR